MDGSRDDIKKTIDRKLRILYVMDYMRENSDEDHPVKLSDIQKSNNGSWYIHDPQSAL